MSQFETKDSKEFNFSEILYDKSNWIATITINRPEVYNAYSLITLQEMIPLIFIR